MRSFSQSDAFLEIIDSIEQLPNFAKLFERHTVTKPQVLHIIFYPWDFARIDLHLGHCFILILI